MTARGKTLLAIALFACVLGMSLGGRIFYLTALFIVFSLLYSFISVLLTRLRLRVSMRLSSEKLLRGEKAEMRLIAGKRGLLPVYPLEITVLCDDTPFYLTTQPAYSREAALSLPLPTQHVGVFSAAIADYAFSDIFGLFRWRVRPQKEKALSFMVLPRPFEVEKLHFLNSDDGSASPNRSTEDLSSPEDVRAYRLGDPLNRIHWKLSARKRELIVRRFETPAPPDTLVLLNCSRPGDAQADADERRTLRDALCETALSVVSMQLKTAAPVRFPLYGKQSQEFHSNTVDDLPRLQEMLACQAFSGDVGFERILQMELRRMRQTGATVIVTAHLNAAIVEGVINLRHMGPNARVYLITRTPDSEDDRPYVMQLQQYLVEVCYVTPA